MNTATGRGFELEEAFVAQYRTMSPPFGFSGLGELVYRRTYSRVKDDGAREEWVDTIARVVEGVFSMQRKWQDTIGLSWDVQKANREARDMFDRFFHMKCLPPGRGLWCMGSALTRDRGVFSALFNCAFVSTDPSQDSFGGLTETFTFLMDASMLGVGVGFDTEARGKIDVLTPGPPEPHVVEDSREGWVESMRALLDAFFVGSALPQFDYSLVRPAGSSIKGFGGVSQGPEPLKQLHQDVLAVLSAQEGQKITSRTIVDINNLIGRCVVAGNVRRSAEIAFGSIDDDDFLELKDYSKNPERAAYGWASNNSVIAELGADYTKIADGIRLNGEPGILLLENMRQFGRMQDPATNADYRVAGANPCVEQSLESFELCNLVETFPHRAVDLEDYLASVRASMLYAKTVTLSATSNPKSNHVMLRNRRIGCSMSGIAQFIAARGIETLRQWCQAAYEIAKETDEVLSERWCIPRSIKITSIKPSGTVSLLAGATPGIHFPESEFYLRRVRIAADSDLLPPLIAAGYHTETCVYGGENTKVVDFPVAVEGVRTAASVSMWEQLSMAAFLQRVWADNQISATVTFDPETEGHQISHALDIFQYLLKGVSFLPRDPTRVVYAQAPYEPITKEEYEAKMASLKPVEYTNNRTLRVDEGLDDDESIIPEAEKFCTGDHCVRKV